MKSNSLWISIVAVIISFIGGFILANAFNRNELDVLRAENSRLKTEPEKSEQNQSELALTEDEIKQRIAEADQNPTNFTFQKNLGLGLYRYAAMKQDSVMLGEVEKILVRANKLNDRDVEVLTALGNLQFDVGYMKKQNENFAKAREYYAAILAQNPRDVNVRTDYGLTYFLQNPADYEKAVSEFQKSLEDNPKHEKTLQFLMQSQVKTGNIKEAEITWGKLKELNPNTPAFAELQTQITMSENAPKK